jgi:regulator of protease activity HflC (stomatin/prohibitin superfamily)
MLVLQWFLYCLAVAMLLAAVAMILHENGLLPQSLTSRFRKPEDPDQPASPPEAREPHWKLAGIMVAAACLALLAAMSIAVVPSGSAGVLVSQISGTLPTPLYPGTHFKLPLIHAVELYDIRDRVYETRASVPAPKAKDEATPEPENLLRVQTKEGLTVGLAAALRYRVDPQKLATLHATLPQPYQQEILPTVVASVFRELLPNYTTRDTFGASREEIRRLAVERLTRRLNADGILVKEVLIRDIALPVEYAKGMEGLLLKEQENERMALDLQVKEKGVRTAELEAEAEKARRVKEAEAEAATVVLQAKAEADAMQYTLPLKEKQIQQTRLEAEARKESTVKNAEAAAQAKVVDSRAELERRKLLAEADAHRTRLMAVADADRMKYEAAVLKDNPLLIQKIIAERLSDKVQIMMVPTDGKFFFANDVLRSGQMVSLGGKEH